MVDVAKLGIAVDSSDVKSATTDLKGLGAQSVQTESQVMSAANKTSKAFSSVAAPLKDVSATTKSFDVRGVSMQLSQVAQQASATGNVVQALAIQLPDIGLAFGTVGIAAGVVAGALLPVAANFIGVGDAGKEAQNAIDDYHDAISRTQGAIDLASTSLSDLTARFGENAAAAREAAIIQAQISAAGAERDARAALDAYQKITTEIERQTGDYLDSLAAEQQIYALAQQGLATEVQLANQKDATAVIAANLEETTGRTVEENIRLNSYIQQMRSAMESGTISSEFRAAAEGALEIVRNSGSLDEGLQAALESALDLEMSEAELARLMDVVSGGAATLSSNLSSGANEASRMADEIQRAVNAQLDLGARGVSSLRQSQIKLKYKDDPVGRAGALAAEQFGDITGYDPVLQAGLKEQRDEFIENAKAAERNRQELAAWQKAQTDAGKATKKGASAALKEHNEYLREAEQLYDKTRSAAERYRDEIADLDELLKLGYITQDTYNRALSQVAEESFNEQFGDLRSGVQGLTDDLLNAASAGESLVDVLLNFFASNLLKSGGSMLTDAITSGIGSASSNSIISALFGVTESANGNVFSRGRVIPHANGGVVDQLSYFPMADGSVGSMAEEGPEAIMPLRRGPDGKLGVASSGGSASINNTTYVNAQGSTRDSVKIMMKELNERDARLRREAVSDMYRANREVKLK